MDAPEDHVVGKVRQLRDPHDRVVWVTRRLHVVSPSSCWDC